MKRTFETVPKTSNDFNSKTRSERDYSSEASQNSD